jgi:hypothetical protein
MAMERAYPDALVYAKPFGDFVLIARACGSGITQREEAGDCVIIHSAGTVIKQDMLKANNAWSRSRHDRQK